MVLEIYEFITEVHFPDRIIVDSNASDTEDMYEQNFISEDLRQFIMENLSGVINSFKPFKSSGPDGIFPALLQNGTIEIKMHMIKLYVSSLSMGFIPKVWRKGKIVFIPKTGSRPNDLAKSYRPITLSSFMLKTLEKLLDKYIRQNYLSKNPLHPRQFAYQEGKSTSMAVKALVTDIERLLSYRNSAIGLSLDIEGAFDNVRYDVLKRALEIKEVSLTIINWIYSMLKTRTLECEIAGDILQFKPSKGCPQGGAHSPLLWTLVIDELLYKLNNHYLRTDGFADDLFILISGFDLSTMSELIQKHVIW